MRSRRPYALNTRVARSRKWSQAGARSGYAVTIRDFWGQLHNAGAQGANYITLVLKRRCVQVRPVMAAFRLGLDGADRPSSPWNVASHTASMGSSLLLLRGKVSDDRTRQARKVPRGHDDGGAPAAGVESDTRQLEQPCVDVSRQSQQVAKRGDGADLQAR